VEGALTALSGSLAPALVGLRCRTADRTPAAARGVEALVLELGERLGVEPRLIGSAPTAGEARATPFDRDLVSARGCLLEAGGQIDDALENGLLPILVAGDPAVGLTTVPTVARLRPEAKILWLAARGAFHTPLTSPDRYLGGMALAGACGRWDSGFTGTVDPRSVICCGVRALEEGERTTIAAAGIPLIGTSLETLVHLQNALDGAPTFVHLDAGVLDPEILPQSRGVPEGLSEDKVYDLLDAVADSCEVLGLVLTGFEAQPDEGLTGALAELVCHVVDPLLPPSDE
jgi:arginase